MTSRRRDQSSQQQRRQHQRARATNHRIHQQMRDKRNSHDESAEENVEMGTKDDKRPADNTTTQNDPSPPKRSWSASEEVSTPPTGKGTKVSKDVAMTVTVTCKRAGSTRQSSSRSRRDSSETRWKKKQLRRSRGVQWTVQKGQEVLRSRSDDDGNVVCTVHS